MSLGFSDFIALVISALGIYVVVLEVKTFLKNCKWPWRWIYMFKAFSALYMSVVFFLAFLNVWGADGRVDQVVGRIGAILILASLALGAIIQYRREGC